MASKRYELEFWGGVPFRYRRWHPTYESAAQTAHEVYAKMQEKSLDYPNNSDYSRAAHTALVTGPEGRRSIP